MARRAHLEAQYQQAQAQQREAQQQQLIQKLLQQSQCFEQEHVVAGWRFDGFTNDNLNGTFVRLPDARVSNRPTYWSISASSCMYFQGTQNRWAIVHPIRANSDVFLALQSGALLGVAFQDFGCGCWKEREHGTWISARVSEPQPISYAEAVSCLTGKKIPLAIALSKSMPPNHALIRQVHSRAIRSCGLAEKPSEAMCLLKQMFLLGHAGPTEVETTMRLCVRTSHWEHATNLLHWSKSIRNIDRLQMLRATYEVVSDLQDVPPDFVDLLTGILVAVSQEVLQENQLPCDEVQLVLDIFQRLPQELGLDKYVQTLESTPGAVGAACRAWLGVFRQRTKFQGVSKGKHLDEEGVQFMAQIMKDLSDILEAQRLAKYHHGPPARISEVAARFGRGFSQAFGCSPGELERCVLDVVLNTKHCWEDARYDFTTVAVKHLNQGSPEVKLYAAAANLWGNSEASFLHYFYGKEAVPKEPMQPTNLKIPDESTANSSNLRWNELHPSDADVAVRRPIAGIPLSVWALCRRYHSQGEENISYKSFGNYLSKVRAVCAASSAIEDKTHEVLQLTDIVLGRLILARLLDIDLDSDAFSCFFGIGYGARPFFSGKPLQQMSFQGGGGVTNSTVEDNFCNIHATLRNTFGVGWRRERTEHMGCEARKIIVEIFRLIEAGKHRDEHTVTSNRASCIHKNERYVAYL